MSNILFGLVLCNDREEFSDVVEMWPLAGAPTVIKCRSRGDGEDGLAVLVPLSQKWLDMVCRAEYYTCPPQPGQRGGWCYPPWEGGREGPMDFYPTREAADAGIREAGMERIRPSPPLPESLDIGMSPTAFAHLCEELPPGGGGGDDGPEDLVSAEFQGGVSSPEGQLLKQFLDYCASTGRAGPICANFEHKIEPFLAQRGQSAAFDGEIG